MARVHKLMAKDSLNSPGVLRHPNGDLTQSQNEAAELLLDTHFPGNERTNVTDVAQRFRESIFRDEETINEIVTRDRALWAISSFKPYKSPGYDELYPVILQKAWDLIQNRVIDIYKASIRTGYIPKQWQQSE